MSRELSGEVGNGEMEQLVEASLTDVPAAAAVLVLVLARLTLLCVSSPSMLDPFCDRRECFKFQKGEGGK